MGIGHKTLPNPQFGGPGIASRLVFHPNLSGKFQPSRDWGPTTMASLNHKNLPVALRKNTYQHYSTDWKWQHFLLLLSFLRVQEWCVNCLKWPEQRKPALYSLMKLMLLGVCHHFCAQRRSAFLLKSVKLLLLTRLGIIVSVSLDLSLHINHTSLTILNLHKI